MTFNANQPFVVKSPANASLNFDAFGNIVGIDSTAGSITITQIVPLTGSEIASPTAAQLANYGVLYENSTTHALYHSNGTALASVGSGGGGGDAVTTSPLSQFASTSSAQLRTVVSDETGIGSLVFNTNPVLVAPTLGVATATSLTLTTDLAVSEGGTGSSALAAHGVLIGNGAGAIVVTAPGTSGQVLTSGGASADPTWQTSTGSITASSSDVFTNKSISGATNTLAVRIADLSDTSAFAKSVLDDTDAATFRRTIGVIDQAGSPETMTTTGFGMVLPDANGGTTIRAFCMQGGNVIDSSTANSGASNSDLASYKVRQRYRSAATAVNRVTGLLFISPVQPNVGGDFNCRFPLVMEAGPADGALQNTTTTVTMTSANPGVVTWNTHGFVAGQPIKFTTTGALPTNVTAGTTYYVIATGLTANAFQFSATVAGAAIDTTAGAQSGTHTGTSYSASFFVGFMDNTNKTFTATEPSAFTSAHYIGIGWDSTGANSANLCIFRNDGSGTPSVTDLGATFSKTQGQLYRLVIDKNSAGTEFYVKAVKIIVGGANIESQTYTFTTDIPGGANLMYPYFARSSMGTICQVDLDFAGLFMGKLPNAGTQLLMINEQLANYTLAIADKDRQVDMNVASANTLTVPPNSSVNFPLGTVIPIVQKGAGTTTITAGAGVTFVKPAARSLAISAQYEAAQLHQVAIDTWRVIAS